MWKEVDFISERVLVGKLIYFGEGGSPIVFDSYIRIEIKAQEFDVNGLSHMSISCTPLNFFGTTKMCR
jgi:hypothetical protein